jgi:hypothetical protein
MAMENEPVNPTEQSNNKQNEDAAAALLALAGLAGLAGLAWLGRKKAQARQVTESQKPDPSAAMLEKIQSEAGMLEQQRAWEKFMRAVYGKPW